MEINEKNTNTTPTMNNANTTPNAPASTPSNTPTTQLTNLPTGVETANDVINAVTADTLEQLRQGGVLSTMSLLEIKGQVHRAVIMNIEARNAVAGPLTKLRAPKEITPDQMAMIVLAKYHIRSVACAGMEGKATHDVLAIYQSDGIDRGIYDQSEMCFRHLARTLNPGYTKKEYDEFTRALRDRAERVVPYIGGRYIAVNNGIIDYEDKHSPKQLLPFSPDYIFLSKSRVNYNPLAPRVTIHNDADGTDWNVEECINELVDAPDVRILLWQVLGAVVRPGGSRENGEWGGFQRCILLMSTVGCNGKGTFCQLARNLCGPGTYMSIPIDKIGKNFLLEPLIGKTAIICDESNVGGYLDECATLKSLITHDPIQINRKNRPPIDYRFNGITIFCLNDSTIRVKDKSPSFLRRLLCINFPKSFQSVERTYIKDDYINRPEVLEYVLCKVINLPNYYVLDEPQECKDLLGDLALANDPLRQFVEDVLPLCSWDLLPLSFIYQLYLAYIKKTNPSGSPLSRPACISGIMDILPSLTEWECPDIPPQNGQLGKSGKKVQRTSKNRMDWPEPLIVQYGLHDWYNPYYHGDNVDLLAMPKLSQSYRGLLRRVPRGRPNLSNPPIAVDPNAPAIGY